MYFTNRWIPLGAAICASISGLLILASWQFVNPLLRAQWFGSLLPAMPNVGFCFVLLGIALGLLQVNRTSQWLNNIGRIAAGLAIALATFSLKSSWLGWRALAVHPTHAASLATFNSILLSTALLLRDRPPRYRWLAQAEIAVVLLISGIECKEILLETIATPGSAATGAIALPTFATFMILGAGILSMFPRQGLLRAIARKSMGGAVCRHLLPWALVLPCLFHYWLSPIADSNPQGIFETRIAETVLETMLCCVLVVWTAVAIDRLDVRCRRSEQQLRRTNRRFTHLMQRTTDGFVTLDRQWRFTYVNAQAELIMRRSKAELLGQIFWQVYPDAVNSIVYPRLHYAMQAQTPVQFEVFSSTKNIWLEIHAFPNPAGLEAYCRDISDRKAMEIALQESRQQYQSLVNSINGVVWEADPETLNFTFVSPQAESLLGYPIDRWLEPGFWLDVLHPDDRDRAMEFCLACNQAGQDHQFEYRAIAADGRVVWLQDLVKLVREGDRVAKLVGLMIDISDRKQAEINLQCYERIVSATSDGISLVDRDYRYQLVNPAYLQKFDRPYDAVVGHTVSELVGQEFFEGTLKSNLDRCLAGEVVSFELWYEYPALGLRFLSVTYSPYRELDGTVSGVAINLRDLTRLKRTEEELQRRDRELLSILQAFPDILFFLDDDGTILEYKTASLEDLYVPPEELLNQKVRDFLPAPVGERWFDAIQEVLNSQRIISVEYALPLPRGETFFEARIVRVQADRAIAVVRNISDRKRAELALAEQEAEFRAIFEQAAVGIGNATLDGQVMRVNQAFCDMLGYSKEELTNRSYASFTHPDDVNRDVVLTQQLVRGEISSFSREKRCICKNGSTRWMNLTVSLVRKANGEPKYMLGIKQDISDRKRAELALAEREAEFRAIFEQAAVGIGRANIDGQLLTVNPKFCEMLGYSDSELLEKTFTEITHPDDLEQNLIQHQQLISGVCSAFSIEKRYIRKDNTYVWSNTTVSVIYSVSGEPKYLIAIAQDISDRKRAELALAEQEAEFRAIFEQAAVGIGNATSDGRMVKANQALCTMLGYSQEELLSKNYMEFTHPEDLALDRALTRQLIAGEIPFFTMEKRCLRKDGSIVWTNLTVSLVRDSDGEPRYMMGIIEDINDRKRIELKLQESQERLNTALEAARMGTWDWDILRGEVIWSGTLEHLMSLEAGAFDGRIETFSAMTHPDDRDRVATAIQRSLELDEPYNIEFRFIKLDGSIRWSSSRGTVFRDASGQPIRMTGMDMDISDRKQMEEALRASEARFRAIFEHADIGIAVCAAPDYKISLANPFFLELLGCTAEEMQTLNYQDITHPEDLPLEDEFIRECIAGTRDAYQMEKRYIRKDGTLRWVSLNASTIRDDAGNVQYGFVAVQDISDRKRAEEQLLHQAERERTLRRVVQAIRQSLNLQAIFVTAVVEITRLLDVDLASIYRYLPEQGIWQNVARHDRAGIVPTEVDMTIPDVNNPIAARLKQLEAVRVDNTEYLQDEVNTQLAQVYPGAWMMIPLDFEGQIWGSLTVARYERFIRWSDEEVELADAVADQLAIAIQQSMLYEQLQQANQQLHHLANHDALTQIANRRFFDETLDREWSRMVREEAPLSLILGDIDYFKQYNDTYGHPEGDVCLQAIARALVRAVKRPADLVARYGGEEFAAILPNTDEAGAEQVVRDIQAEIQALNLPHMGSQVATQVTMSFGIVCDRPTLTGHPQQLVDQADAALYRAKQAGRNRYVTAQM